MAMNRAIPFLVLLSLQQVFSSKIMLPGGTGPASLDDVCTESFQATAEATKFMGNQATYRRYEEFSITWTVVITEGKEVADEIARRYGFTNTGQVSGSNGTYKFILNDKEAATLPRSVPFENKTRSLMLEKSVVTAEQNIMMMVCSSGVTLTPTNMKPSRRKRQIRSVLDLRVDWLSNSHARLRWRHTSNREPPEGTYYSVIHAAAIVIDGRTLITFQFFTVSHQNTSFTLRGVSENNFNIFAVFTSTPSDGIHAQILMQANVTRGAPQELAVELLTSTSIRVQWNHPTQGQPSDRYSVIVYNGNVDEHYTSPSATSVVIHDLIPNGYYVIVVIAIWGSSYGAVYTAYKLALDPSSTAILPRLPYPPEASSCAIICPVLISVDDGVLTMTGFTPNSTATYTCANGYQLFGNQTRTCQTSGEWTGQEPRCSCSTASLCSTSRQCIHLNHPENGRVQMSGYAHNAIAYYTCNNKYELIGQQARVCGIDQWSGQAPICRSICYNSARAPTNGNVTVDSSIAHYSCNSGFELDGVQNTSCSSSGQWNDETPTCRLKCSHLINPANGHVRVNSSTAFYTCNTGFELVPVQNRSCQSDGDWSGEAPTCRFRCSNLTNPANGQVTINGAIAFYSCNTGFKLDSVQTRRCQNNGEWSGEAPTCLLNCSMARLTHPDNGEVIVNGSTAIYTCRTGFKLIGSERKCDGNGQWTGEDPHCILICHYLENPTHGRVNINGTTATYICDANFELIGNESRICQGNGIWSGQEPNCEGRCSKPKDPPNGNVTMDSDGSTVLYTCNDEYELVGDKTRTCLDSGQWSGQAPSCVTRSLCPKPEDPVNGRVTLANDDTTASYTCNINYELVGAQTVTCQDNGQWNEQSPTCCRIAPSRDAPKNVDIVKQTSSSLRITWSHPIGGQPTSHYSVSYTHLSASTLPRQRSRTVSPSHTSDTVMDLDLTAGNYYIFIVTAVSGTSSESSDPETFYLHSSPIPPPPTAVTVQRLSATGVQLNWRHPSDTQPLFYFVYYSPVGGSVVNQELSATNSVAIHDGFDDDAYIVTVVAGIPYRVAEPVKITMCRDEI